MQNSLSKVTQLSSDCPAEAVWPDRADDTPAISIPGYVTHFKHF